MVQVIGTNQEHLPVSHPDLLQAKSQHWLQPDQGVAFYWAYNSPPISTLQATWGKMQRVPRKSARLKADCFRNIFSMAPTLWMLLQHGQPFTSTSSGRYTPRCLHGPICVSAGISKLQSREEHKNLCSKWTLTNNLMF